MVDISAGLRRAARRSEYSLAVLVRPGGSDEASRRAAMDAVRAAVGEAEASPAEIDRATPLEIQETLKGPAVILSDVDPPDMLPVIERLAHRLDSAGLADATLTVLPSVNPWGRDEDEVATVKCWMVYRGRRPDGWSGALGWPKEKPYWQVDADDQQQALTQLTEWITGLSGPKVAGAVTSTGDRFVPVPVHEVAPFMHRAQRDATWLTVNWAVVSSGQDFRKLDLNPRYGLAAASIGVRNGKALDWPQALEEMRQLIAGLGDWCGYAHLTHGRTTIGTSTSEPDGDRHVGNPWASQWFDWAEFITDGGFFDAYPVMRLPRDREPRVSPLWNVRPVSATHILAEHPDPAAWFSHRYTDPDTLTTARHALGDALLDRSNEGWPSPARTDALFARCVPARTCRCHGVQRLR